MAFTSQDFSALIHFLEKNPEKNDVLYRMLLASSIIEKNINEIVEIQKQTEQRIGELTSAQERTEKTLAALAERTDKRFSELAEAITVLTKNTQEFQNRVDGRFNAIHSHLDGMDGRLGGIDGHLGNINGMLFENKYIEQAEGHFGNIIKHPTKISKPEVRIMLDNKIPEEQVTEVLLLDLVLQGKPKKLELPEVYLAAEISMVIDEEDVKRSDKRAGLLRKAGYATLAVCAGTEITNHAKEMAKNQGVVIMLGKDVFNLDTARL